MAQFIGGASGSSKGRKFEIRAAADGHSLFISDTHSGGRCEKHGLDWADAHGLATAFVRGEIPLDRVREFVPTVDLPLATPLAPGATDGFPTVGKEWVSTKKPPYQYTVSWVIDVEADSPKEAAHKAAQAMYPGTTATTFTVTDSNGDAETIDIAEVRE